MPISYRELTRSRVVAAHRAADFGADKPYHNSGDYWTGEQCDAMTKSLVESGFREDILITIEPLARSILALARDAERLMIRLADWWGRRNPVVLAEGGATPPKGTETREPGWFRFFITLAAVEAGHGNHGHVVVAEELTDIDEHMLKKFARRLGLKVNVTRNSDEWLADKKGVSEHKSKVEYTVDHLRSGGSDFRASRSRTPDRVQCAKAARLSGSVAATAGALASASELTPRPVVTARQEPETGGPRAAGNGADGINERVAHVDAIPTVSPDSGKPGNGMLTVGRHTLVELHLEEQEALECRSWRYRIIKFAHTFRDAQGRRYRWYGSNPRPVNMRGYKYPGRYPVLRGVPLTFAANIREVWPDGTVSLSRPYVRLDRQPEATRRAYAKEFEIPLGELGLESEPDADVVAIETAQDETSGEILSRNGSRAASKVATVEVYGVTR